MGVFQGKLRASRAVQRFGAAVVAAMIVAAAVAIVALRDREIQDWREQMGNMSLVLAEHTSQTVFAAYLVLDSVTERIRQAKIADEDDFRAQLSTPEMFNLLRDKIRGLPQVDVATIVAANGDNINFSRSYPVPSINLAERDYFKAHLENPQLGDFISRPVRNKGNGKWTFYISRRIDDAKGNFLGLVLVGMSVEALTAFHERVARNLGEGATISLFRNDLMLLTRWPFRDEVIGTVNRSGAAYDVIEVMKQKDGVVLRDNPRFSTGEPVRRLVAVRALDRYPLVVALVATEDLFLSSWRRSAALIAGITGAGVLILCFALLVLVRSLREREADMVQMERLKTEAEAASLAKSKFLATMSHEIRTPMNGILGMAQLLQMPGLTEEERHEYAGTILSSGNTLLSLLNEILDLSKVEAGKLSLVPAGFDPREIVEETAVLFSEPAVAKGLRIEAAWQGPAGRSYRADPVRLRQMLSNLVSNAVKFTEQGKVQVAGAEIENDGQEAVLEFTVIDTGLGIPMSKQAELFKPFSQMDGSITREYGGTGLGLSIVRSLARLMGGEAGVDSEVGKGARFWFRIRVEVVPDSVAQPHARPALLGKAEMAAESAAGSVLVVEDDPVNRLVVAGLLRNLGFRADCVVNGEEAVAALQNGQRPDVVLMDVQMPVLDGLRATEQIRLWEEQGCQPRLPIIALTAGVFEEDRQYCIACGMDDFLAKPVNIDDLAAMLAKWIVRNAELPPAAGREP